MKNAHGAQTNFIQSRPNSESGSFNSLSLTDLYTYFIDSFIALYTEQSSHNKSVVIKPNQSFVNFLFQSQELVDYFFIQLEKWPSITNLDLSDRDMTSEKAQLLSSALINNHTLKTVSLYDNPLGDDGARSIAAVLLHNNHLEYLDLGENKFKDHGIWYLCKALYKNRVLKSLNIGGTDISTVGAQYISDMLIINDTLKELDLSFSNINDEGTKNIARGIEKNVALINLDLSGNFFTDIGLLALNDALKNNFIIKSVNLNHNDVANHLLNQIASYIAINKTKPQESNFIDTIIKKVVNAKVNIVTIRFQQYIDRLFNNEKHLNYLLSRLNQFPQIQYISLIIPNNKNLSNLLDTLLKNTTIKGLIFSDSNIDDEGARLIAKFIEERKNIISLDLTNNNIEEKGVGYIAQALNSDCAYKLNLTRNKLGDAGVAALSRNLRGLVTFNNINLSFNNIGEAGAQHVGEIITKHRIRELDLSNNDLRVGGAEHLANFLKGNRTLIRLSLASNHLHDEGAKIVLSSLLETQNNIQNLNLSSNSIGDNSATIIGYALMKLMNLNLQNNEITSDGLADMSNGLRDSIVLKAFDLSDNRIDGLGMQIIEEALTFNPNIIDVNIEGNLIHSYDSDVAYIGAITKRNNNNYTVTSHHLNRIACNDEGGLERFTVDQFLINQLLTSPQHMKSFFSGLNFFDYITELHMADLSLNDEHLKMLEAGLVSNTTIHSIVFPRDLVMPPSIQDVLTRNKNKPNQSHIVDSYIGKDVLYNTGDTIRPSKLFIQKIINDENLLHYFLLRLNDFQSITALDLSCSGNDPKLGDDGLIAIANAVTINSSLRKLDLDNNGIRHKGMSVIADVMKNKETITSLNLNNNPIGYGGIKQLFDSFIYNKTLRSLHLKSTDIGAQGVQYIGNKLMHCHSIEHLDLGNNAITDEGIRYVSADLDVNTVLKNLDLSFNRITSQGILSVANALKNNNILEHLDVQNNQINDEGVWHAADALKHNNTLKTMNFRNNTAITSVGLEAVLRMLNANTTLTGFAINNHDLDKRLQKQIEMALSGNKKRQLALEFLSQEK